MKHLLLLASRSPRRKKILKFLGFPFRVVEPRGVREQIQPRESPQNLVRRLAIEKAIAVSRRFPKSLILGADTVVVCRGKIFGKPKNQFEAAQMLMDLQGHDHVVWTGVALVRGGGKRVKSHFERTKVFFKPLGQKKIREYVKSKEPYDKAGGYDIQGTARSWIEKWEGDYFNVMGLPIKWVIVEINRGSV